MLNNQNKEGAGDRVPSPNRELLEQTKLSRLPSLPQRMPFRLPDFNNTPTKAVVVVAVCAGCGGRLDSDDNFQQSIHGCRKCIGIYARIDAAIEESAKRKKKELLEKFAAEVKR
jgi:hypothetical protein